MNSYLVLSMNNEETIHFIPNLISGLLPNLYVTETFPKVDANSEEVFIDNTGGNGQVGDQNIVM